jgi:hypothetical protein
MLHWFAQYLPRTFAATARPSKEPACCKTSVCAMLGCTVDSRRRQHAAKRQVLLSQTFEIICHCVLAERGRHEIQAWAPRPSSIRFLNSRLRKRRVRFLRGTYLVTYNDGPHRLGTCCNAYVNGCTLPRIRPLAARVSDQRNPRRRQADFCYKKSHIGLHKPYTTPYSLQPHRPLLKT